MKRYNNDGYRSIRNEQRQFMSEMMKATPTWFKLLWVGTALISVTVVGLLIWLLIKLVRSVVSNGISVQVRAWGP